MYVKAEPTTDVNRNTEWFTYPGVWTTYMLIVFMSWLLVLSIFGCSPGMAWTIVHFCHFAKLVLKVDVQDQKTMTRIIKTVVSLSEGLPSFEFCPLLAKRWQREVVEDWPRISHNTEIEMNFERSNEKAVIPELLFHSSTTIRIFLSLC